MESELSSLDLRSKLFHSFKSKGILQSVKTELRNRLVSELQKNLQHDVTKPPTKENIGSGTLLMMASNSLVADHLANCSYDYTLSVFFSESLVNPEKKYSTSDILQLLHINPESKLYKKLIALKEDKNMKSFLWSFLMHISEAFSFSSQEASIQTEEVLNHEYGALDRKLFDVERTQMQIFENKTKEDSISLEAKFLSLQRKYEAQKRAELSAEMEQFKTSQLANMRLVEQEKCQQEVTSIKLQYDQTLQKKLKELEKREEDMSIVSARQKKMLDNEAYEHRQKILSELHALKERELELEKVHELALKSVEVQEEKLRSKNEQLKYKEEAFKDMEEKYESRLKDELTKVKFELQQEEKHGLDSLNLREQQLREEKIHFGSQKESFLKWKSEAEKLKEENEKLHLSLLSAKQNVSILGQKCEDLVKENLKFCNYENLKNENIILHRDVEGLQKNIDEMTGERNKREKEHQKLVKDLLGKITTVSSNTVQSEPKKDIEEQEARERYMSLEHKYRLEVLKNEELQKLYEDSLLSQRELLREIDELRTALTISNQEKEKLLRSGKSSVMTSSLSQTVVNRNPPKAFLSNHNLWLENNVVTLDRVDASTDVLKKLEQEALELEKSYKDFQERQKLLNEKSPSRVHFSSYIQNQSHKFVNHERSGDSFDISHLIPNRTVATYSTAQDFPSKRFPDHLSYTVSSLHPVSGSSIHTGVYSSTTMSQPLSSTQAPGGYEAPSFGISGLQDSNILQKRLATQSMNSANTIQKETNLIPFSRVDDTTTGGDTLSHQIGDAFKRLSSIQKQRGYTIHSLTQHPLPELTDHEAFGNSLTQYPLNDTRNYNTLSQYPLMESDSKMSVARGKDTISPRLVTLPEQSSGGTDALMAKTADLNDPKDEKSPTRLGSLERDLNLIESSISTFDSPTKLPDKVEYDDVFHTPASEEKMKSEALEHTDRVDHIHVDHDMRKENEERYTNSSSVSQLDVNELISCKEDLSEGELIKKDEEVAKEEQEDMMAKYMQMVLEKRKQDEMKPDENIGVENSIHDDIAMSEDEYKKSEKSSISEFEW